MRAWAGAFAGLLLIVAAFPSGVGGATAPPSNLTPTLGSRWAAAADDTWLDVIVNYESWDAKDTARLTALDAVVVHELFSIPTVFAWVPTERLLEVARLPGVALVENNEPIEYDLDTAIAAANVTPLWPTKESTITVNGNVVDGKGVTIAVVDTGVNSQHEDIKYQSKVVKNVMALGIPTSDPMRPGDPFTNPGPLRWEETDNSDGGGHGSHVAGIVAGNGAWSNGKFKGSAPGASLAGLGSQASSFWYAVAAWDWVFQNHDKVSPKIRAITNSWGYATAIPCNPDISLTKVQKRLVLEANVVMLFSAGNTGGDGARDVTRTQFKCPWEGNIGVGNYFDNNAGLRDWYQSNSSARGSKADPATWPDVSAPGTQIMATNGYPVSSAATSFLVGCQVTRTAGQGTTGCYRALSGTSMSTPFTAGVVALVLQVRPDLKPADVEYILEQTAYKFETSYEDAKTPYYSDPAKDYRNHGSHYFKGHGLVDAAAAVQFALTYDGTKTPVVYAEKESPTLLAGPGTAKKVGGAAAKEDTPGFELALLAAAAVAVFVLRPRRNEPR